MAFSVVVCKWGLLAVLLSSSSVTGFADLAAVDPLPSTSRALCTSTDSPGVCLFKGLLKNALFYVSRRYAAAAHPSNTSGKVGTESTTGPDDVALPESKGIEAYLFEQFQNLIGMFSFDFELPTDVTAPWTLLKSSFLNGKCYKIPLRSSGGHYLSFSVFIKRLGKVSINGLYRS
jgi:hypothetical protein